MKKYISLAGILGLFFSMIGTASAALPAAVATAFTDLLGDVNTLIDLAWTIAVPVTIAFIVLRMFRKAANSAT